MRRQATRLDNTPMNMDDFANTAFWKPIEVESAYMDQYGNFVKSPDKKVILNSGTGEYVSTVGKNYSIVDNQEYFYGVIKALTDSEIEYIPKRVYNENKRTTMVVTLPQFSMFPNTSEHQDFELRIRNSFDCTLAADTILGLLRLICTNGMTTFDKSFEHRMLHRGDMIKKAEASIELYKNFQGVWENTKKEIEMLNETIGDKHAVTRYIGDGETSLNTLFKGPRWATKILTKWQELGEPTNLWELYNMFTHTISHEYGNGFSSKQNKMDELNKEVKSWQYILDAKRRVYNGY